MRKDAEKSEATDIYACEIILPLDNHIYDNYFALVHK